MLPIMTSGQCPVLYRNNLENEVSEFFIAIKKYPIGLVEVNAVNARDLWTELEVGTTFSRWIQRKLEEYNFTQAVDFVEISSFVKDETRFGGKRKSIEYIISLDMAKELAMVERTDKGKIARQYFIDCERRVKLADEMDAVRILELKAYLDRVRRALLLDTPHTWEKIYPVSFFEAIMSLHGHTFNGNSSTPSYCSKIIRDWVYQIVLPGELLAEIDRIQGSEKKHQWFTQQGGRQILAKQVEKVEMLALAADSRKDFEQMCKKVFKKPLQLGLRAM